MYVCAKYICISYIYCITYMYVIYVCTTGGVNKSRAICRCRFTCSMLCLVCDLLQEDDIVGCSA